MDLIGEIKENFYQIPILMGLIVVYAYLAHILFFKPVLEVLQKRREHLTEASSRRDSSKATLENKLKEYENQIRIERQKGMLLKEGFLKEASKFHSDLIGKTKDEVRGIQQVKMKEINETSQKVKTDIDAQAHKIARMIVSRLLGRTL